jgi:putative membrane protein
MIDFLGSYYNWIKALHVIAVMSWMAGMLYLPRLYVYHVAAKKGSELSDTLKIMEKRLLRFIMNPAMMLSWVFGIAMIAANPALFDHGWMHIKFTLIVIMTVLHMVFSKWRKDFAADRNVKSAKFYKISNEAPTVLLIIIVIMAVAEPF